MASRVVSVRELARSAAALTDDVEMNGAVFALSRRGRMVALLTPLAERTVVEFAGPTPVGIPQLDEGIDVDPEWLSLGPAACDLLLRAWECYPMPFSIGGLAHSAHETAVALGRLELAGLIERIAGGREDNAGRTGDCQTLGEPPRQYGGCSFMMAA